MITVKEVFDDEADAACAPFNLKRGETERVFRLYDGKFSGVGLTRFEGGAVRIRAYKTDAPASYGELLLRTLLLDATRMGEAKAIIEQDGDYEKYGFQKSDGLWTNICGKIIFPHECKGEV